MTDGRIPPLPAETVEFNVLNDALAAGHSPADAADMAIRAGAGEAVSIGKPAGKSKTAPTPAEAAPGAE